MLEILLAKTARAGVPLAIVGLTLLVTTGCEDVIEEDCFEQAGGLTQVTTDTLTVDHYNASLSPDGTQILFTSDYWARLDRFVNAGDKLFGQPDIGIIDTPTPGEERPPIGDDQMRTITGRRLSFTGLIDERNEQIDTVNAFKSEVAWIDGQRFAVVMTNTFARDRIFVCRLGDVLPNGERAVTGEAIVEEDRLASLVPQGRVFYTFRDPAVSPDRQWIAYARNYTDVGADINDPADDVIEPQAIFAYNLVDGRIVRITNGSSRENQPTWSPDGNAIAFVSNGGSASLPEIYRVSFDPDAPAAERQAGEPFTDGRVRLTNTSDQLRLPESSFEPTWLRDGQIVFTSTRRVPCSSQRIRNIWIMNGDGSNPRPLVVSRFDDNFPMAVNFVDTPGEVANTLVFSSRRNRAEALEGQKMDLWVLRGGL